MVDRLTDFEMEQEGQLLPLGVIPLIKPNYIPTPHTWSNHEVTVAWLGHASFLINFFGTRILIDPALNSNIGITPIGNLTLGPSRHIASQTNKRSRPYSCDFANFNKDDGYVYRTSAIPIIWN